MNWTNNYAHTFPLVDDSTWEKQILKDLKGTPLSSLVATNWEGIPIQPHYTKSAISSTNEVTLKEEKTTNAWQILATITNPNPLEANKEALFALQNGANAILFKGDYTTLDVLLNDIQIDILSIHFAVETPVVLAKNLKTYCDTKGYAFSTLTGSITYKKDGIQVQEDYLDLWKELENTSFACIAIDTTTFATYGANATQEIGLALAKANEVIGLLISDVAIDKIASKWILFTSVGFDYFVGIAKIRALKEGLASLLMEYGCTFSNVASVGELHTLLWTTEDAENNLLRASTAAMSAAIGGYSAIAIPSFTLTEEANAKRLSTNIQLLLQEEASLGKVIDPAKGSYYMEYLTNELLTNAWSFFQFIEQNNGYVSSINTGVVQEKIQAKAEELIQIINEGTLKVIGKNTYTETKQRLVLGEANAYGFKPLIWE